MLLIPFCQAILRIVSRVLYKKWGLICASRALSWALVFSVSFSTLLSIRDSMRCVMALKLCTSVWISTVRERVATFSNTPSPALSMLRTNFWIGLANPVDRPYEAITAKTTAPRVMAMALLLAKLSGP